MIEKKYTWGDGVIFDGDPQKVKERVESGASITQAHLIGSHQKANLKDD